MFANIPFSSADIVWYSSMVDNFILTSVLDVVAAVVKDFVSKLYEGKFEMYEGSTDMV